MPPASSNRSLDTRSLPPAPRFTLPIGLRVWNEDEVGAEEDAGVAAAGEGEVDRARPPADAAAWSCSCPSASCSSSGSTTA